MDRFRGEPFDLVITDIRMPDVDGVAVLKRVKELDPDAEVIILTGFAAIRNAVETLRNDGAFDYLIKPLEDMDELLVSVSQALERRRLRLENQDLLEQLERSNTALQKRVWERTRDVHKANRQTLVFKGMTTIFKSGLKAENEEEIGRTFLGEAE